MTREDIATAVNSLAALRYFPADGGARVTIMQLFERMVTDQRQLDWLTSTLIDRVGKYQGTDQLRAVFCTRFKPKDGIEANLSPDCPLYRSAEECEQAEKLRGAVDPRHSIAAVQGLQLAAPAISDEEAVANVERFDSTVRQLAAARTMPDPKSEPQRTGETQDGTGPSLTSVRPITEADVDRAMTQYRIRKLTEKQGAA